jgi:hypothetical protein
VLKLHRRLLALRRQWIAPRLAAMGNGAPKVTLLSKRTLRVIWRLGDGSGLSLVANLGDEEFKVTSETGNMLFATSNLTPALLAAGRLPPWSVAWHLQPEDRP